MNCDITFCVNDSCSKKDICVRYCRNAPRNTPVSMAYFDAEVCEHYIQSDINTIPNRVKVVMSSYKGLPCELETFKINGIIAQGKDFGDSNDDRRHLNTENYDIDLVRWGCINRIWTRDESKKLFAMEKYNLSEDEWVEVCDLLEAKLSVGECGWCI